MKTPFATLIAVASIALLLGAAIPRLGSGQVTTTPAIPVVQAPVTEQYLVLDASQVPVDGGPKRAAGTLETVINDYGAQGWRVRTSMPPYIIFAR